MYSEHTAKTETQPSVAFEQVDEHKKTEGLKKRVNLHTAQTAITVFLWTRFNGNTQSEGVGQWDACRELSNCNQS